MTNLIIQLSVKLRSGEDMGKLKKAYSVAVKSKALKFYSEAVLPVPSSITFKGYYRRNSDMTMAWEIDDTQKHLIDVRDVLESIFDPVVTQLTAIADIQDVELKAIKRSYRRIGQHTPVQIDETVCSRWAVTT